MLSVEDTELPPKTSKQEIIKPSQTSMQDMKPTTSPQALQTRLNEVERISSLPCMAVRERKLYPETVSSARHREDPVDENYAHIQRKTMSSDHYQKKKPITLKTEKPKFHLGSVSKSYNGNHGSLSNDISFHYFVLFVFVLHHD